MTCESVDVSRDAKLANKQTVHCTVISLQNHGKLGSVTLMCRNVDTMIGRSHVVHSCAYVVLPSQIFMQ